MSTGTGGLPQPAGGGTSSTSTPVQQLTLEDKILLAAQESEQVIAIFKPSWAALVDAAVTIEPIVSGFARLIAGIFKHHSGVGN